MLLHYKSKLRTKDLKDEFTSEPFYETQLFSTESAVLEAAYNQIHVANTETKMQQYMLNAKLATAEQRVLSMGFQHTMLGLTFFLL